MRIELLLDREAEGFTEIQRDLQTELNSLQVTGLRISVESVAPPPGTLVIDQIVKFVIENPQEAAAGLVFVKTLLELASAAIQRRRTKPAKVDERQPPIVIVIDGRRIKLPASAKKQKQFLTSLGTQARKRKR